MMESPRCDSVDAKTVEVTEDTKKPLGLDDVLVNELGQFGWFQIKCLLLVSLPIISSAFMSEYIFSAAAIPHRCQIPECGEDSRSNDFEPEWIYNAIPVSGSGLASCERFPHVGGSNGTLDNCPMTLFDQRNTVACEEYVYARNNSAVYDFNLGCQEWLRALAGTLNSIGTLLVLPFTGFISDRFGRKIALVINVFNMALLGLIRAFSVDYTMYLIFQILQTTLGGAIFSSAYVIATELVGPKYRVIASALSSSMFAVGQVILGLMAWAIGPWRTLIIALHVPCFLLVSYYWILPESVRWLLSKKKYEEAVKILEQVGKVNKTQISEKSKSVLVSSAETAVPVLQNKQGLVAGVVQSRVLLRRVCTTPIWWMTTTFVYYGLSINSTSLSDTMYLNYILTTAIEIPGYVTAVLILDRVGRKATLSSGFFFSAVCNIGFIFIPTELTTLRLVVYLLGKFGISATLTSLYLFTSELYPTEFRHSLLAFSSMLGRIGSICAPFTPVLMEYWVGAPSALFGGLAVVSGLLVLTQPETLGTKLPDTLVEAEKL